MLERKRRFHCISPREGAPRTDLPHSATLRVQHAICRPVCTTNKPRPHSPIPTRYNAASNPCVRRSPCHSHPYLPAIRRHQPCPQAATSESSRRYAYCQHNPALPPDANLIHFCPPKPTAATHRPPTMANKKTNHHPSPKKSTTTRSRRNPPLSTTTNGIDRHPRLTTIHRALIPAVNLIHCRTSKPTAVKTNYCLLLNQ